MVVARCIGFNLLLSGHRIPRSFQLSDRYICLNLLISILFHAFLIMCTLPGSLARWWITCKPTCLYFGFWRGVNLLVNPPVCASLNPWRGVHSLVNPKILETCKWTVMFLRWYEALGIGSTIGSIVGGIWPDRWNVYLKHFRWLPWKEHLYKKYNFNHLLRETKSLGLN